MVLLNVGRRSYPCTRLRSSVVEQLFCKQQVKRSYLFVASNFRVTIMKFVNSINQEAEVQENPTSNKGAAYFKQVPILRVLYSETLLEDMDLEGDPDIEIVVCDTFEEAKELIAQAFLTVDVPKDYGEALAYNVYETSKGFVVTFDDMDLSFGGNIIGDYINQDYSRAYYDCHFYTNKDDIDYRHSHLTPEQMQFWKDLFKELDS